MIHEIWNWIEFNFWLGLICVAAGLLATLPLLLFKSSRRRFLRSGYEIETVGFVALIVAIALIGLYKVLYLHLSTRTDSLRSQPHRTVVSLKTKDLRTYFVRCDRQF
jgi:hypothetical protein